MKTQINIAELLEDCPKGMELYSPLCGKCVFDRLNFGTIICKKQNTQEITFTSKGYYMLPVFDDCECMIFPSKDQRDWSKFVPPCQFKDGDVCYIKTTGLFEHIFIFKVNEDYNHIQCHVDLSENHFFTGENPVCTVDVVKEIRLATEEEKAKLFQEIKDNGYRWSPETKTLEEFVKPKFKVGDRIRSIISNSGYIYDVIEVKESLYVVSKNNEYDNKLIDFKIQDYWELVPNKFDITTLKPFDMVLMRSSNAREWVATFYSHYSNNYFFGCGMMCQQCIPYEGNEHLRGTTNDCDEYYKNW